MSHIIDLPSCGGYHFGSINRLKPFVGCYFEDRKNKINKEIITKIDYNPDEIYLLTDGHAGNCWTTYIKKEEVEII